jgi:hypothetical protein
LDQYQGLTISEADREFERTWKKQGRSGYVARAADVEVEVVSTKLPVPSGTRLLAMILNRALPKGWEWRMKEKLLNLTMRGYSLSLYEAKHDVKNQVLRMFK